MKSTKPSNILLLIKNNIQFKIQINLIRLLRRKRKDHKVQIEFKIKSKNQMLYATHLHPTQALENIIIQKSS
jgi:hypothetical protein